MSNNKIRMFMVSEIGLLQIIQSATVTAHEVPGYVPNRLSEDVIQFMENANAITLVGYVEVKKKNSNDPEGGLNDTLN